MANKDEDLTKKIGRLSQAIDHIAPSAGKLMWRSFLHGLFVALGATIGLSIVIAAVTFIITKAKFVPVINQLIKQTQIEKAFPNGK